LSAIEPLQGLIDSLDEKSQKALSKQYEKLKSYVANTRLCSVPAMKQIFQEVLSYLHKTYLKEVHLAHAKYKHGKFEVP